MREAERLGDIMWISLTYFSVTFNLANDSDHCTILNILVDRQFITSCAKNLYTGNVTTLIGSGKI